MRIISGNLKGRTLKVNLKGPRGFRPTTERVREAMFSILHHRVSLPGLRVLDLFAGSGALGFEALSRGAAQVTFVEKDRELSSLIAANAQMIGGRNTVSILCEDALLYLAAERSGNIGFDLVFVDPPYEDHPGLGCLEMVAKSSKVADSAWVVVEAAERTPLGKEGDTLSFDVVIEGRGLLVTVCQVAVVRSYSGTSVAFYYLSRK